MNKYIWFYNKQRNVKFCADEFRPGRVAIETYDVLSNGDIEFVDLEIISIEEFIEFFRSCM